MTKIQSFTTWNIVAVLASARQQSVSPLMPAAMPTVSYLSAAILREAAAERAASVRRPWLAEKMLATVDGTARGVVH